LSVAALAKSALRLAMVSIPIPLGLILAAGLWLWIDRTSAIRQAVDSAVTDLVAGAELAAKDAKIEGLEKIAAARAAKAAALEAANRNLQASLKIADQAYQDSLHDLEELASAPPPPDCRVDPGLAGRLRNR
ncbi:MAG: hypothetical protein KDJ29_08490, partial [Hyphomicrobiales bacterium]|nr:hypothetical protein [Hyphomicrobiales bacterium]